MRAAFSKAAILRPSVVFGAEDQFFNRFAAMAVLSPVLPVVGGGTRMQPVYAGDIAAAVLAALAPAATGQTYELGGPEVKTFRELMVLMLNIIETPPPDLRSAAAAGPRAGRGAGASARQAAHPRPDQAFGNR